MQTKNVLKCFKDAFRDNYSPISLLKFKEGQK